MMAVNMLTKHRSSAGGRLCRARNTITFDGGYVTPVEVPPADGHKEVHTVGGQR